MQLNGVLIEDTFAEAWELEVVRLVITAISTEIAVGAANQFVGAAGSSELGSRINGGIERKALPQETSDGRPGVIVALTMPPSQQDSFLAELALRVHLATLIPTCAIYDFMVPGLQELEKVNIYQMTRDNWQGVEYETEASGHRVCVVPTITGEFKYHKELTISKQGTDGHFVCYAKDESAAVWAVQAAKEAVEGIDGVSPLGFGLEQVYKLHEYCPGLKDKVTESKVPAGVGSILNLLLFGVSEDLMAKALKEAIVAACKVSGVMRVGAMNFGGQFGPHKYYLHELLG